MRVLLVSLTAVFCSWRAGGATDYFVIRVVDDQTGRGVPLVELRLPNEVRYWTDSAGIAALNEPSLRGHDVFVGVRSHGYVYPHKTLIGRGVNVTIEPNQVREVRINRTMVAERLYRLTGEGIYRDSVMVGLPIPTKAPLLNAQVLGQDTVSVAEYRGNLFWVWGDTIGPSHWNFSVSAAKSSPQDDPAVAVNFHYFTDSSGGTKEMLPLADEGLVWIEGLIPMTDSEGVDRLIATYTRQSGLKFPDECGLALYDDQAEVFKPWLQMPCRGPHLSAHPCLHDGYWYLYPGLRVPDDWNAIQDICRWERRQVQLPKGGLKPSCLAWNEYRQRWILLLEKVGAVYYAEAKQPEGPYGEAVKIIHHDDYNFYNVATHTFFNKEDGRVIFLEGTYTDAFSSAKEKTPRYNYNQIMYRLRLDDLRLQKAHQH